MVGYANGLSETYLWPDLLLWTGTNHQMLQPLIKIGRMGSTMLF
jgi:hypothetical protein